MLIEEKLNRDAERFKSFLEIFVEAGNVPANYHRANKRKEGDLAIGPDHNMVIVYNPSAPKDNYK